MANYLGYTGAYRDPLTGCYPLGNGYRWFIPSLMRFNAPDDFSPFGPGGIHPYAYGAADPINHRDPTGHVGVGKLTQVFEKAAAETSHTEREAILKSGREAAGVHDSIASREAYNATHPPKLPPDRLGIQRDLPGLKVMAESWLRQAKGLKHEDPAILSELMIDPATGWSRGATTKLLMEHGASAGGELLSGGPGYIVDGEFKPIGDFYNSEWQFTPPKGPTGEDLEQVRFIGPVLPAGLTKRLLDFKGLTVPRRPNAREVAEIDGMIGQMQPLEQWIRLKHFNALPPEQP